MISAPCSCPSNTANKPIIQPTQCCSKPTENSSILFNSKMLYVAEKVCLFLLGGIAAFTAPAIFASSFVFGITFGAYLQAVSKDSIEKTTSALACAQGFLEQITKVRFPAIVSLGINMLVTVCHIEHHKEVYVPIVGGLIGASLAVPLVKLFAHKKVNYTTCCG